VHDTDFLSRELLRLLVELPAFHFAGLTIAHGDDDVAVKRPSMGAIELAWFGRMIWMAVIEAEDELVTLGGESFGFHQISWRDCEPVRSFGFIKVIAGGLKQRDVAPVVALRAEDDPAAFVWVRCSGFALDLIALRFGQMQNHRLSLPHRQAPM
jgi:hypothetical protein